MKIVLAALTVALAAVPAFSAIAARRAPAATSAIAVGAALAPGVSGLSAVAPIAAPSLSEGLPLPRAAVSGGLAVLPVAPVLAPERPVLRAAKSPERTRREIKVLREGARKTEKNRSSGERAAALRETFDGGRADFSGQAPVPVFASPSSGGTRLAPSIAANAAGPASTPAPGLRAVEGSVFSRLGRSWGGRIKAALLRGWSEIQRIRKGKPPLAISRAKAGDLARLVEITEQVRLAAIRGKTEKEISDSGFLVWTYTEDYFRHYIEHPDSAIWVARGAGGVIHGFSVVYGKGVIHPDSTGQELNVLARRAIEARYGPDAEMLLVKQMAVDPAYGRTGTGRALVQHILARMVEYGIDFAGASIVNDDPLHGTRYDVPQAKLVRNNASAGLAFSSHGKRVASGFLYSDAIAGFEQDPGTLTTGIHAFDFFALSLNRRKPFSEFAIPESNRAPGSR